MPYDPIRDAPGFRTTLRCLADIEHLTSQAIVDLFTRQRTPGDNLSISRATLDRFIQGEDITKIRELRAIHDILSHHPAYGRYFNPQPAQAAEEQRTAEGLARLFLCDAPTPASGQMCAALPGRYVLMRRDHDLITVDQGVRVSSLLLDATDGAIAIEETQSYRTPDYDVPFEQIDRGYIFFHSPNIYFLMKEIGGTAVKFGVIDQTLPELDRSQPVQYFQGHLMVVSRRGVFPRTRFAARRYRADQHPMTSGIVSLADIADLRAADHLRQDYMDGGAARPA